MGIDFAARACTPRCPSPSFAAPPTSASPGSPVTLAVAEVEGATAYAWTTSNDDVALDGSGASVSATFGALGTRQVCVVATGSCGTASNPACATVTVAGPSSQTFTFTNQPQAFVVPAGVTSVTIEAWGAKGGDGPFYCYNSMDPASCASMTANKGGLGGYAKGTYPVTPGETLSIYVGGQGSTNYYSVYTLGGFNGGGLPGPYAGGGGGASDVRRGCVTGLDDRIIVAGGGGGGNYKYSETYYDYYYGYQYSYSNSYGAGGAGGGLQGVAGTCEFDDYSCMYYHPAGGGGNQTSGGTANTGLGFSLAGSLGQGGGHANNYNGYYYYVTGGGGGYFGGGGGYVTGAGGGSSYLGAGLNAVTEAGVRDGDGEVKISW